MIKIFKNIETTPRKAILQNYKKQLIERLSSAKKIDYPKFNGTLTFSIFDKIYAPECPGVYFVHDKRGVLYIGRTENINNRFTQHAWKRKNKILFKLSQNPFGKLKFSWVKTKNLSEAIKLENKWVSLFLPICNDILNTNKNNK